jgi:hypothetical protein
MRYTKTIKERVKFLIFTAPIRLDMNDFAIKKTFHMFLKLKKHIIDIRLVFEQIELGETTISINKTHIKMMSTDRGLRRTPHIGINNL